MYSFAPSADPELPELATPTAGPAEELEAADELADPEDELAAPEDFEELLAVEVPAGDAESAVVEMDPQSSE